MKLVLIGLIRLYQMTLSRLILAVLGPVCRFTPSCSAYALECIRIHGAARGSLLSVKRLSKCHPFHPGGHDPPPPPREPREASPLSKKSVGSAPAPADGARAGHTTHEASELGA